MRRREHDSAVEENSMERKAYCYDNGCPTNESTRPQYFTHLMGAFKSLSTAPFGRHIIRMETSASTRKWRLKKRTLASVVETLINLTPFGKRHLRRKAPVSEGETHITPPKKDASARRRYSCKHQQVRNALLTMHTGQL